ncbi:MAG: DUF1929 domain-containing protein [Candidatus Eisenbacteria bacterium]|nr:DUF1929 domain-containing protein [Candidatus Eisenbacteria bacterium]
MRSAIPGTGEPAAALGHTVQRFLLLVCLLTLLPPSAIPSPPQPHHPGKWTGTVSWGNAAVHLVLLPGDSTHSSVLWWRGDEPAGRFGGLWRWEPPNDASVNAGNYPTSSFTDRPLPEPPYDIFCAGHAHLRDGRILIAGGHETGRSETGSDSSVIFNPKSLVSPWQVQPKLAYRRWYPTTTVLASGEVLTLSGTQYQHLDVFGGFDAAGQTSDSLRRFGIANHTDWDAAVKPDEDPYAPSPPRRPDALEGLTMVDGYGTGAYELVYGGRRATGGGQYAYSDLLWFLYKNPNEGAPDYQYGWRKWMNQSADRPDPCAFHAAVKLDNGDLVVIGGLKEFQGVVTVSSEVWYGKLDPSDNVWKWNHVYSTTADSLGPRYAHEAVYDSALKRIFVFGGASTQGSDPADADVWSLSTDPPLSGKTTRWIRCAAVNGERPNPRVQHSLAMDARRRKNATEGERLRALLYGGRRSWSAAPFSDTLWVAWFKDSATVEWQRQTTPAAGPGKRARHAGVMHPYSDRFFIAGGDLSGLALPDSAVWVGSTYCTTCDNAPVSWSQAPSMVRGRAGHRAGAVVSDVIARVPEVFDPGSGTTGSWTTHAQSPRLQDWYPFMFQLPAAVAGGSRKVFFAGPEDSSFVLDLGASPAAWSPFPANANATFGKRGGSGVMYRIGKVMKSGSRDTELPPQFATDTTMSVDLGESGPSWKLSVNDMGFRRVNHDLVLLPTGEVLTTGGTRWVDNTANQDPNHQPELWNPDYTDPGAPDRRGYWYGTSGPIVLDSTSATRGYHNNALLMPDGRVLCASGSFDGGLWSYTADLYSPPYLFNSDGTTRTRSAILGTRGRLAHGDTFSVVVDSTNVSFVLLRAGSSTHGFDQDQRYLPLADYYASPPLTTPPRRTLRIPAAADSLPPGPYLLFAVKPWGTPSIARWLMIGSPPADDDWGDRTRPGLVGNLSKVFLCPDYQIRWTAPADDSTWRVTGRAVSYDLRYANSPINTWTDFQNATPVSDVPAPADQGTFQSVNVSLDPGLHYYFRLVSYDDHVAPANRSLLSNDLSFIALGCDGALYGGSGSGGRGASLQSAGRLGPSALQQQGSGFAENSLLPGQPAETTATDLLRLEAAPQLADGRYQVHLRRGVTGSSRLDRVRLVALDRSGAGTAFVLPGRALLGAPLAAASVTRADRTDLTAQATGGDVGAYQAAAGETLLVSLPLAEGESAADLAARPLLLRAVDGAPQSDPASIGILIQVPDGAGGWRTVAHRAARQRFAELPVDSIGSATVRLVFLSDQAVSFVGRIGPASGTLATQAMSPATAQHSRLGALDPAALVAGGAGVTLAAQDTLVLGFDAGTPAAGDTRDWYLEVTGEHLAGPSQSQQRLAPRAEGLPRTFALGQNRPNPFTGTTTIHFDLPVAARVRLEVFDLQGRRVRRLLDAQLEAGRHQADWDRRGAEGTLLPAGVYLCRMQAGTFHDERTMVVFP